MPFGLVSHFFAVVQLYLIPVLSIVNQYNTVSCWDYTDRFQHFLRSCLGSEDPFGLVFRYSPELRRAEQQLHTYFLCSHGDFRLSIDGLLLNDTDDNVYTGQSLFDRVVFRVVEFDHLGVT